MITQAKNRFAYYWEGYPYDDASDVTPGGGGDEDYVTKEEMNAAIEDTVKSIAIKKVDDDSFRLVVGGHEYDQTIIDDIYLTDVQTTEPDDDGNIYVNFIRSNDTTPISVNIDDLDNPIIDCKTF